MMTSPPPLPTKFASPAWTSSGQYSVILLKLLKTTAYLEKSGRNVFQASLGDFSGGVVATSTENRPVFSNSAFIGGVIAFQLWLFWPSMISSFSFSAAMTCFDPAAPNTARIVARNQYECSILGIAARLRQMRSIGSCV